MHIKPVLNVDIERNSYEKLIHDRFGAARFKKTIFLAQKHLPHTRFFWPEICFS